MSETVPLNMASVSRHSSGALSRIQKSSSPTGEGAHGRGVCRAAKTPLPSRNLENTDMETG